MLYDIKPKIEKGVFRKLKDLSVFINQCTIMNDTLAWDVTGTRDETRCIDIDLDTLYALAAVDDQLAG